MRWHSDLCRGFVEFNPGPRALDRPIETVVVAGLGPLPVEGVSGDVLVCTPRCVPGWQEVPSRSVEVRVLNLYD
ncbi:MAG: hypothetical protein AAF196_09650 [Planctomycetota bacterium]